MMGRFGPRISLFPGGCFGVSHSDVTLWEIQVPDSLLHGARSTILGKRSWNEEEAEGLSVPHPLRMVIWQPMGTRPIYDQKDVMAEAGSILGAWG